jgi:hypothetical protein
VRDLEVESWSVVPLRVARGTDRWLSRDHRERLPSSPGLVAVHVATVTSECDRVDHGVRFLWSRLSLAYHNAQTVVFGRKFRQSTTSMSRTRSIPDHEETSGLVLDLESRSLTQENFNAEAEDT